jgi:tRNA threonylcarbamoyl adenosine modification protein (Sua5/YciO/YrdC/YwlC family)
MPPTVIELGSTEDSRDVVHRAVQALAEGQLVAFPTETDYVVAAAARSVEAVKRLSATASGRTNEPRLSLAVKSIDEALDWAPRLSPLARRLARRCWPGPVAIIVADDHPESLVHRLPKDAREAVVGGGRLRIRVPGHPMLSDCMRMLSGPVALAEPRGDAGESPATAAECVRLSGQGLALVIDDGRTRYAQPPTTVEVEAGGFRVVRPGVVPEETIRRLSSLLVLFVCTGNTCRSPMAETVFRSMVSDRLGCRPEEIDSRGVVVASAGLSAWSGSRASSGAIEAMREIGLDLSGHESQPLTEGLVRQADVILTMTAAHKAAIMAQFPEAGSRVAMLSPDRHDVLDPIGGPVATYRACAAQIRRHLESRIEGLDLPPVEG